MLEVFYFRRVTALTRPVDSQFLNACSAAGPSCFLFFVHLRVYAYMIKKEDFWNKGATFLGSRLQFFQIVIYFGTLCSTGNLLEQFPNK